MRLLKASRCLIQPIDVEKTVQHGAHRAYRARDISENRTSGGIMNVWSQGTLKQTQRLQWLPQVVARRGKETRLFAGSLLRPPHRVLQPFLNGRAFVKQGYQTRRLKS